MPERVIIVGAGMAGLNLASALGLSDKYQVILLERDPQPKDVAPADAFFSWERRGVAHFRQAHFFLPRLLNLYRRRQPALLEELFRSGARELAVRAALPAHLAARYVPLAGDERCSFLLCRRATVEAVLRDYVANLSAVDILPSTRVSGVVVDRSSDRPRAVGVEIERGSETAEIFGDVIVDATGRMTRFPAWFRKLGIKAVEETNDELARAYYTRFYRAKGDWAEPTEFGRPVSASSGYLTCNLYPADDGFFSVTFAFEMQDQALRHELRRSPQFHRACETIPQVAQWVRRAEPVTDVLATGGLRNCWRTYIAGARPVVCGFFAIGDALAQTNPGYGAGCSWAAQHAHALADTLEHAAGPEERALLFDQRVRTEAYPFYSLMAANDQRTHHAQQVPKSDSQPLKGFRLTDKVLAPVRARDIVFYRWSLQRQYMMRLPEYWPDRFFVLQRLLLFWILGRWRRRCPRRPQLLTRSEFLGAIRCPGQVE